MAQTPQCEESAPTQLPVARHDTASRADDRTAGFPSAGDETDELTFLAPSESPDELGRLR